MKTPLSILTFISLSSLHAEDFIVSSESEFNSAVSDAQPGDQIIWENGIYSDIDLSFDASGSATQPITLRAETNGQVVFQGESALAIGGEYLHIEGFDFHEGSAGSDGVITFRTSSSNTASYCRVTQCRIRDVTSSTTNKYVNVYGHNNRFDHNDVGGKRNEGAMFVVWLSEFDSGGSASHTIDSNIFSDLPEGAVANGFETIRIGTSGYSHVTANCVVSDNYFEDCSGEIEIVSNKSAGNRYTNNVFFECQGGLTLRHGNDNHVEGNYFFGNNKAQTAGVRIINEDQVVINNYFQDLDPGDDDADDWRGAITLVSGIADTAVNGYHQVKNAVIAHNTIVNCVKPIVIGAGFGKSRDDIGGDLEEAPENCSFINNLVYGSATAVIENQPLTDSVYENNISYPADAGVNEGFLSIDPQLALSGDLWRPAATSPVINYSGATAVSSVTSDMDQQSRDSNPDIGSDEVSLPNTKELPSASNSGPDWLSGSDSSSDNDFTAWITKSYEDAGIDLPNDYSIDDLEATDLDDDEVAPIVEYAVHGGSLFSDDHSRLPAISSDSDGNVAFSFQRNLEAEGLIYTIQRTIDLTVANWANVGSYATENSSSWSVYSQFSVTESAEGVINFTYVKSEPKEFFRLKISEGNFAESIASSLPRDLGETDGGTVPNPTLYLEAESASDQANFTGNWSQADDSSASGGSAITAEGKNTSEGDDSGSLSYNFTLLEDATVYVWVKVLADSGGNNSCYMKSSSESSWSLLNASIADDWQWIQWSPQSLSTGDHSIDMTFRESGFQVDQIVITTSSNLSP